MSPVVRYRKCTVVETSVAGVTPPGAHELVIVTCGPRIEAVRFVPDCVIL